MKKATRNIFITGGTGYIGQRLIPVLLDRGHQIRALVRNGSKHKLPGGCEVVTANVLVADTFRMHIGPVDTMIHLVGVSHPNPLKAGQFRKIDLGSVKSVLEAIQHVDIQHFVYISVAQPAPVMKSFIQVRATCERLIRDSGVNATFLRPWYVLGPGHWWPYLLMPAYYAFEKLPWTRETARRLSLVKREQMIQALAYAVDHPCKGVRIMDVDKIHTF